MTEYLKHTDSCLCSECKNNPSGVSASDSNDLLSAAGDACIDFYMQMHVSGMREQIEPLKKLWSIGQELYLAKRNGR